jgi:flagellar biosynthesis protein
MSETQKPPLAVALHYDGEGAPKVTATGRGVLAEAIVQSARDHGVPIQENAPLAEMLAQVELDERIPEELYRAVAEVLAFVLRSASRQFR